jgi:hypothetical protein
VVVAGGGGGHIFFCGVEQKKFAQATDARGNHAMALTGGFPACAGGADAIQPVRYCDRSSERRAGLGGLRAGARMPAWHSSPHTPLRVSCAGSPRGGAMPRRAQRGRLGRV